MSAALAAPSDRINMGFIGVGGMGMNRLRGFLKHADVNPVAICDLDSTHTAQAVAQVEKDRNTRPQTFNDYRKLLALKELDAV